MSAFDAWVAQARSVPIERVLERHQISLRGNGHERVGPCPKCGGTDRFSINTTKNVFNCRRCPAGGDVIELEKFLNGGDFNAACETLTGEPPPKKKPDAARKVVVEQFDYPDAAGVLRFAVERIEYQNPDGAFVLKDGKRKKTFRQKRPDPENPGRWIFNLDGVERLPYRQPELLEAVGLEQTILIPEGERCVNALRAIGIPATCNSEGAGKWRPELNQYFADADVVLLPDNDEPGRDHVNEVGAQLTEIARRIRMLALPDLPSSGDVRDWLAAGGIRERLDEMVATAPEWQPPAAEPATKSRLRWHGVSEPNEQRQPWLIKGLLKQGGTALVSGQWGTGKTFMVLDLAGAVITKAERWIDYRIKRHGGVLFIAAEGAGSIPLRLDVMLAIKLGLQPTDNVPPQPFAWIDLQPNLLKHGADELITLAQDAATEMRRQFNVDLALIIVDTVATAAGFKDEDSAAEAQQVMAAMGELSRATSTLVLGVDHFGKDANTGTRGSSAKEDYADTVLCLIGDRSVTGQITNLRGAQGARRRSRTRRRLPPRSRRLWHRRGWRSIDDPDRALGNGAASTARPTGRPNKSKEEFNTAVDAAMKIDGATLAIKDVQAVKLKVVKDQFKLRAGIGEKQKTVAERWRLALNDARQAGVVKTGLHGGEEFLWWSNQAPPQPPADFWPIRGYQLDGIECVQCGRDGAVFRIRDGRVKTGEGEALHEACAEAFFTGKPPP
jgi:hypothetical protein